MVRSLPLLAVLAGSALAAESTTIKLIVVGDQSRLVGSVIDADATATTVVVNCPADAPSDSCGLPRDAATVAQGESTWRWDYRYSDPEEEGFFTQKANCKLDPVRDIASCFTEVPQGSTTIYRDLTPSPYKTFMYPVTITAGAEKLSAAPGATATQDGSDVVRPTKTGTQTAPTQPGGAGKTDSTMKPTNTTNAGPLMTHNAVLAGVACVIGGILAV